MDIVSSVVASIREAELPAELYRTARELLDLAGDNGQVKISRDAMMAICKTQADGTMRRQLYALKKANIVHVSINEHVHVSFVGFPTVDQMITARASEITARAPEITPRARESFDDTVGTPYDDDQKIIARAPEITARAPEITARALPHTRGDRLIDRSSNPSFEEINQSINQPRPGPKRAPRQPWEAPLSYQLLTDKRVAMRRADAERLAAEHPFHHIRDAVAAWWDNRKSGGGRFEDYPGIVVYWLDNPAESVVPVMSDEFARNSLCRDYLPPDEAQPAAGEEDQDPPAAADPDLRYEPEEGTPEWAWLQVCQELGVEQGGSFDRWVRDTRLHNHDPDSNTFTIALPDAIRYDWIVNRLSRQIKRKLRVLTGREADVTFIITAPGSVSRETQSQGDST